MAIISDPELGKIEVPGALTSPKERERIFTDIKAKIDALATLQGGKSLNIEEPEPKYQEELHATQQKAQALLKENLLLKQDINSIITDLLKEPDNGGQKEASGHPEASASQRGS